VTQVWNVLSRGRRRRGFMTRVARFFLVQQSKTGKIYQTTIKYTKWPQNIPNSFLFNARGRCYDHLFLRFLPIFGEKNGVFLKIQCYILFLKS
jgi:hypothetical protein